MAEDGTNTATADSPADAPTDEASASVYAGKFKGEAALEAGIRELGNSKFNLGLPDNQQLIGSVFVDADAAENFYKDLEKVQSKGGHADIATESNSSSSSGLQIPSSPEAGSPPPPSPTSQTGVTLPDAPSVAEEDNIQGVMRKAGLDPLEVLGHFDEHGQMSDAHYAQMQKVGFSKGVANQMAQLTLSDIKATQAKYKDQCVQLCGGSEDTFNEVINRAATHYSDEDLKGVREALEDPRYCIKTMKSILYDLGVQPAPATTATVEDTAVSPGSSAGCADAEDYWKTFAKANAGDQNAVLRLARTPQSLRNTFRE